MREVSAKLQWLWMGMERSSVKFHAGYQDHGHSFQDFSNHDYSATYCEHIERFTEERLLIGEFN